MNYLATLSCASSTLALMVAGVSPAHAQTAVEQAAPAAAVDASSEQTAAETADPNQEGEIVVTGSRIARASGYEAPQPLTVVSQEQLQLAAPTTIADGLNQLPQFRGSSRPQTGGVSANTSVGANLLNLRNLGPQRNLILLDGRRLVPTTTAGVTDVNVLPQELVQRVEIVTGGASAAYGSDAVAGVVNFVLDTNFRGLKAEAQAGVSTYGDSQSEKATVSYGVGLGERVHFIASGEYFRNSGIGPGEGKDRDYLNQRYGIIPNVPATGIPNRLILDDGVTVSAGTYGGLITAGPLAGTQFGPGGVPQPFAFGTLRSSTFMVGGDGVRHEGNLTAGVERWSTFGHLKFDVSDDWSLFLEGNYAESLAKWDQYFNWTYTTSALTIFSGNPFIPAATQAEMTARGLPSITLGRIYGEGDPIKAVSDGNMWRVATGFDGKLGGSWTINGYYTHGESGTKISNLNVLNHRNIYAAVDAVRDPATGAIVCRSTLLFGLDPGCAPLNPFGQGSPSQAAIDFYQGDEFRDLTFKQDVVTLNMQGNLFSLWSEPAGVAVGVEYRKESAGQTTDVLSRTRVDFTGVRGGPAGVNGQLGHFIVGNPQPLAGGYNIKEAFVELNVPIVEDKPFLNLLEFNGAARLTDYSTSGNVTTWKLAAVWKPFEDLRIRATRSRDIRGPNVAELFTGSSQSIGTVRDPATGLTESFIGSTQGNPVLDPEKADTFTIGAVYQPSWFSGFSASVDYYDIKIDGAIASLSAQQTLDECFRGSAVACSNIEIIGGVRRVRLPQLNLQSLSTYGVDLEASYRFELAGGMFSLRALANYQGKFETITPGAPAVDRVGEVGQSSNPKWLGTLRATWVKDGFTAFLQERYIHKGTFNATFVDGRDINDNTIPAVWYTDATVSMKLPQDSERYEIFLTVNNLLNKDPPLAPQQSATIQRYTNSNLYDTIGRYFTAGVKLKF